MASEYASSIEVVELTDDVVAKMRENGGYTMEPEGSVIFDMYEN